MEIRASDLMARLREILGGNRGKLTWFQPAISSPADTQFEETKLRIHRNNPDYMLEDAIRTRDLNQMTVAERLGAPLVTESFRDPLTIALEIGNQAVIQHLLKLIEIRAQMLEANNLSAAEDLRRDTKRTLTKKLGDLVDDKHLRRFEFLLKCGADITQNAAWQTGFFYKAAGNGHAEILECLEKHRQMELIRLSTQSVLSKEDKAYKNSLLELPKQKDSTGYSAMQKAREFGQRAALASRKMLELLQGAASFTPPQLQTPKPA